MVLHIEQLIHCANRQLTNSLIGRTDVFEASCMGSNPVSSYTKVTFSEGYNMSEYFVPKELWCGKICYVFMETSLPNKGIWLLCRILKYRSVTKMVEIEMFGTHECVRVSVNDLYDKMEGYSSFFVISE